MSIAPKTPRRSPPPWDRVSSVFTLVTLGIMLVAVVVNAATFVINDVPPLAYVAVVLSATGVALALRRPYTGLALVVAAAPAAVAASAVSTGIWSIACFYALLVTLRGSSALITGAVVAISNFVAAGWEVGTIDVHINASASIAAFAAIVAAAIGSAIRGNLQYRKEVEQRMREAELSQETAVERGVAQERLRIARDLHDSVGHQVAVVNMRLGAAEVHLPPDADAARADLASAREAAQAVLRETQEILRVLRIGDDPARAEHTFRSIPELVQRCRDAGMQIEDDISDPPPDISPQASAAIYRIVQEALTNAQKYGVGAVSLAVRSTADDVRIQVVNMRGAHRAAPPGHGGNGLVGMRERAESTGGTLEIRSEERLFWLDAVIPVRGGTI
ncbi:MAG: histidine kinase [Microbacterium sp.]